MNMQTPMRERNMPRAIACLALCLLLLLQLTGVAAPPAGAAEDTAKLVIHYLRSDGKYDGWNLWIWEKGKDGRSVPFTGKDEAGVTVTVEVPKGEIGFLIRLNEWEEKDVDQDRFVTVNADAQLYLKSRDAALYGDAKGTPYAAAPAGASTGGSGTAGGTPAAGAADAVGTETAKTLHVVYFRFDQAYGGWNLWLWPKDGEGAAYPFTGTQALSRVPDKIAVTADIDVSAFGTDEAGLIVRLNEWEAKDVEADRFVSLKQADKTGTETVYLVQGLPDIAHTEAEAPLNPGIADATFRSETAVELTLQAPAPALGGLEGVTLTGNGQALALKSVLRDKDGLRYMIVLPEPITPGLAYEVKKEGYGAFPLSSASFFGTKAFEDAYAYAGDDLGAAWSPTETRFRLWAPTADKVVLNLFDKGDGGAALSATPMTRAEKGTWTLTMPGDFGGKYYTYSVSFGSVTNEAVDPYATAVGLNGQRGMVLDFGGTNPQGWDQVGYVPMKSPTDAVLYEIHVRDVTVSETAGITAKGKFLGLAETGTKSPGGAATGLDHMKELGVTHVHLLPSFDYFSVDEASDKPQFNWGYDPQNYNAPEGSYATDARDGSVRVKEFKEMVKAFKAQGIGVVMDVVYNHTGRTTDSNFNLVVPDYYYRQTANGKFANGSGCGNETASERAMVRKYIVDSVVWWAKEYKVDGFRFDLMALEDIETMNAVRAALEAVNPNVLIYGEGWTGGTSPLPANQAATKANVSRLDGIAVFNDSFRDGVKGHVFEEKKPGFVGGAFGLRESVKFGIVGAIAHPGVRMSAVNYDKIAWAASPAQCVNYVAAHDNLTLYDKFLVSSPKLTDAAYAAMTNLGNAITLTSQGIPFLFLGTEFMRSKGGDENSYKSPDAVNAIDWTLKEKNRAVFDYQKGLLALRAAHPAFRMATAEEVKANLAFLPDQDPGLIAYTLSNHANGDDWGTILVAFNAGKKALTVPMPADGSWQVVVDGTRAGIETLATVSGDKLTVAPGTALVAVDAATVRTAGAGEASATAAGDAGGQASAGEREAAKGGLSLPWGLLIGVLAVLCLLGIGIPVAIRIRRK